jgi:hypothetical protein
LFELFATADLPALILTLGHVIPEGSVIGSYAYPFINVACISIPTLQSCWLPVSVMSLVSQPDPSTYSDEQRNVEVQDKIDTEQDNETQ